MANAKISFFFSTKMVCFKTKQNVFLEKKNSTKIGNGNEADDRKEKKKS
jgi:hypothetical protein